MPPTKRRRAESVSSSEGGYESDNSIEMAGISDDDDEMDMDMDISSALTGKRRKVQASTQDDDAEDDEDLAKFLKDSMAKRDVKEGTQVLKKAKGKGKVGKGEVGGGSFQSMGTLIPFRRV